MWLILTIFLPVTELFLRLPSICFFLQLTLSVDVCTDGRRDNWSTNQSCWCGWSVPRPLYVCMHVLCVPCLGHAAPSSSLHNSAYCISLRCMGVRAGPPTPCHSQTSKKTTCNTPQNILASCKCLCAVNVFIFNLKMFGPLQFKSVGHLFSY